MENYERLTKRALVWMVILSLVMGMAMNLTVCNVYAEDNQTTQTVADKSEKETVKATEKETEKETTKETEKESAEETEKETGKESAKESKKDSKKESVKVKDQIAVDKLLTAKVEVALNIREKATTDSDIVGKLYRGSAAEIIKKKGKWYKIKSGKVTGWVRKDLVLVKKKAKKYLDKMNPKTVTVTGSYVNVRKKDSTDCDVVAVVKEGSTFMCLKKGSEWVKVQLTPDHVGYISADYVKVVKDYGLAVSTKTLNKYLKAVAKKTKERQAKEAAKNGSQSSGSSGSSGGSGSVGDSEFTILAAICEREAGDQYENCVAVANVVLNRVNSPSFPNSISGVVFQSGQFCSYGTLSKYINRGPNSTAVRAARDALNGYNNIGSRKSFRWVNAAGAYNHSNCVTIGDNVFF